MTHVQSTEHYSITWLSLYVDVSQVDAQFLLARDKLRGTKSHTSEDLQKAQVRAETTHNILQYQHIVPVTCTCALRHSCSTHKLKQRSLPHSLLVLYALIAYYCKKEVASNTAAHE
jgi:hypothetical protein